MPKVWRFAPHDESLVRQLCRDLSVQPLTAQILVARGYQSAADATAFLDARLNDLHDPELMPGLNEAADRIVAAAQSGRRITIYGDYDVDGVTGTSLLWHCLKLEGASVDYYIPSRLEEGYGLNCDALRQLHSEDPERLVVSVDCGITSVKEAELARELGLELIITDHHEMAAELPQATGLVHPRLPGGEYPFGDLCGAGVAFKLAWGICQRLGDGRKASPRMREFLINAVGLAALGTVADVVPLHGENRVIVRFGLERLSQKSTTGLKALMQVAGLADKPALEAEDIAFSLAPRINAAGRLGQARLAVELLTTDNAERAAALADYLDELNNNRKTVERRILRQAKEQVAENPEWESAAALVLSHEEWHPGVIGIVASRVAEHFERPVVLVAMNAETGLGQGSGRTFAGFDLHGGLTHCAEFLETFGGHQAAAGLKVKSDRLGEFRNAFAEYVGQNHEVRDSDRELAIDAEVRLADCHRRGVLELDRLGPFGQKNRRPIFAASGVELAEPPRKVGRDERTLLLQIRQNNTVMKAIAFGRPEWAEEITASGERFSISFTVGINHYRGFESVELQLRDWRPLEDHTSQVAASSSEPA